MNIPHMPACVALPLALALCAPAPSAQDPDAPPERPKYKFLRQDEDWSSFRAGDDFFDPLKHVELTDDVWVSFGGRFESRLEVWNNFNFGAPAAAPSFDDQFVLSRAFLHADLHVGDDLRFFVEGKTAQATDRDLPGGRRPSDLDTLALQQAFVDYTARLGSDDSLRLRVGRQMLLFGVQRLVSPLPWGNALRTWDGVTASYRHGPWDVTGLYTAFVPVDKTGWNERDYDQRLYGVYARHVSDAPGGYELYWLHNERASDIGVGAMGDSERDTFGGRRWAPLGESLDYEVEGGWQIGDAGSQDVSAAFVTANLGWKPGDDDWKSRYWVGFDYASGGDNTSGDVDTFDQIYPLGHAYFGYIDAVGRQNILAGALGGQWTPKPGLGLEATLHSFWLADSDDALYNAGGAPFPVPLASSHVGYELDLLAKKAIGTHLGTYAGYSLFFTGDGLDDAGADEDARFFYLGMSFTF